MRCGPASERPVRPSWECLGWVTRYRDYQGQGEELGMALPFQCMAIEQGNALGSTQVEIGEAAILQERVALLFVTKKSQMKYMGGSSKYRDGRAWSSL